MYRPYGDFKTSSSEGIANTIYYIRYFKSLLYCPSVKNILWIFGSSVSPVRVAVSDIPQLTTFKVVRFKSMKKYFLSILFIMNLN